jgi:hypothetical protein
MEAMAVTNISKGVWATPLLIKVWLEGFTGPLNEPTIATVWGTVVAAIGHHFAEAALGPETNFYSIFYQAIACSAGSR